MVPSFTRAETLLEERLLPIELVTLKIEKSKVIYVVGVLSGMFTDCDVLIPGLRRREAELKAKLAEIHTAKPRGNPDDALLSEIARIGAELTLVRDDFVCSFFTFFTSLS